MSTPLRVRIGTRGSPLALAQAHEVQRRLCAAHPSLTEENCVIVPIKTTGDRVLDRHLADIGGKGLFTKELEEALYAGDVDIAVHSMKDVPTELPEGLTIACILEREDPRDVFISHTHASISSLPEGARVGTSSLRRQAQILHIRPDLRIVPFRGNVATRIKKLEEGEADAIILALAGLKRLQAQAVITEILPIDVMLPAVAQGAIGIECCGENNAIREVLVPLHHAETALCVTAERAFLRTLEGNCRTPLAALAVCTKTELTVQALLATPDGKTVARTTLTGAFSEAEVLGINAAKQVQLLD